MNNPFRPLVWLVYIAAATLVALWIQHPSDGPTRSGTVTGANWTDKTGVCVLTLDDVPTRTWQDPSVTSKSICLHRKGREYEEDSHGTIRLKNHSG